MRRVSPNSPRVPFSQIHSSKHLQPPTGFGLDWSEQSEVSRANPSESCVWPLTHIRAAVPNLSLQYVNVSRLIPRSGALMLRLDSVSSGFRGLPLNTKRSARRWILMVVAAPNEWHNIVTCVFFALFPSRSPQTLYLKHWLQRCHMLLLSQLDASRFTQTEVACYHIPNALRPICPAINMAVDLSHSDLQSFLVGN